MPTPEKLIAEARECFGQEMILYSTIVKNLTAAQAGFKDLDPNGKADEETMRVAFVNAIKSCLNQGRISQRGFDLFVRDNHENPLVKAAFPYAPIL